MILDDIVKDMRKGVRVAPLVPARKVFGVSLSPLQVIAARDDKKHYPGRLVGGLNSGPSSAIVQRNSSWLLFKGNDPYANIRDYAFHDGRWLVAFNGGDYRSGICEDGFDHTEVYSAPHRVLTLTRDGVMRVDDAYFEIAARHLMDDKYAGHGLCPPRHAASVYEYSNIYSGEDRTACVLYQMETLGHDLRLGELDMWLRTQHDFSALASPLAMKIHEMFIKINQQLGIEQGMLLREKILQPVSSQPGLEFTDYAVHESMPGKISVARVDFEAFEEFSYRMGSRIIDNMDLLHPFVASTFSEWEAQEAYMQGYHWGFQGEYPQEALIDLDTFEEICRA